MSKSNEVSQLSNEQLASLRQDKSPERELWLGIEYAILNSAPVQPNGKQQKKAHIYASIAATVCLFALSTWFVIEQTSEVQGLSLVAVLSNEHQKQKQALLLSFADTPSATNNWQQQLADLDEAEAAIKQALTEAPHNPALLSMLKQVYEQQLAIIETVHAPAWQTI